MRVLLFTLLFLYVFADEQIPDPNAAENWEFLRVDPQSGNVCNINQGPTVGDVRNQYYECRIPTVEIGSWNWPQLGIWVLENCTQGLVFNAHSGLCKNESNIRRQYPFGFEHYHVNSPCNGGGCGAVQPIYPAHEHVMVQPQPIIEPVYPSHHVHVEPYHPIVQPIVHPVVQPVMHPVVHPVQPIIHPIVQPAHVHVQPAHVHVPTPCGPRGCVQRVIKRPCPQQGGGLCSWMMAPLRPGNGANSYLQCTPAYGVNQYCGRWKPRRCAYGTRFHPQAQICIRDPRVPARPWHGCQKQYIPIGPCGSSHTCPGQAVCQQPANICCQQPSYAHHVPIGK